jgi:hypothetical protein
MPGDPMTRAAAAGGAEEVAEHGAALVGEHAVLYLHAVVEARVVAQREQAAGGAGLGVGGAVDEAGDAGVDEGPGAHRARLEGDVEGGAVDSPAALVATGLAEGDDLGVAAGVGGGLAGVEAGADDGAGVDDDGADRDVAAGGGVVGEAQGLAHVHEVEVGRRGHARGASRKSASPATGDLQGVEIGVSVACPKGQVATAGSGEQAV